MTQLLFRLNGCTRQFIWSPAGFPSSTLIKIKILVPSAIRQTLSWDSQTTKAPKPGSLYKRNLLWPEHVIHCMKSRALHVPKTSDQKRDQRTRTTHWCGIYHQGLPALFICTRGWGSTRQKTPISRSIIGHSSDVCPPSSCLVQNSPIQRVARSRSLAIPPKFTKENARTLDLVRHRFSTTKWWHAWITQNISPMTFYFGRDKVTISTDEMSVSRFNLSQ